MKPFGATMQGPLVTGPGARETGRSAGEAVPDAVASLLDTAL